MLTDTVISIDSGKEYSICLTTKNLILERRLHKLQPPSKIPLFNFDPNYRQRAIKKREHICSKSVIMELTRNHSGGTKYALLSLNKNFIKFTRCNYH